LQPPLSVVIWRLVVWLQVRACATHPGLRAIEVLNTLSPMPKIAKARARTHKALPAEHITSTPYKKALEDKAASLAIPKTAQLVKKRKHSQRHQIEDKVKKLIQIAMQTNQMTAAC